MTKKRRSVQKPGTPLSVSPTQPEVLASKDYDVLLTALKNRIQEAQLRAGLAVNRELVLLYWQIGKDVLHNQERLGWGAKVIDRLSVDLCRTFPQMKGFSPRNLKYMRAFAEAWPDRAFVQQAAAQIPWFHNCVLLDRVREQSVRQFYVQKTIEHGWSRAVLELQIESRLHERQGKAVTNFRRTLPTAQSDLATQILKDPYNFDFLTLGEEAHERDLEEALLHHIRPHFKPSKFTKKWGDSRGEGKILVEALPGLLEGLNAFMQTSTLDDQLGRDRTEALFRLGQYFALLQWDAIKEQLDKAQASKPKP